MGELSAVMIGAAAMGAALALIAAAGKLSRRLGEGSVKGLYYASYACTGLAIALFVARGLFGGS